MPHIPEHKLSADDLLGLGEGGGIGILEALLIGQRFQAIRRDDGSLFAFDRVTGKAVSGDLAPAAPTDPAKPNISFHRDPNTGDFFAFDETTGVLQVISEETPEVKEGFQHILEAALAIDGAGLNPLNYNFVFEDERVVPTLIDQIPQTQDSFSTATDASGQLLAISRLTGTAIPIGATPKASDIPSDAKVELDPVTKQFKITQPNGQISFLQAPVDIKLPQEVTIGGQTFAFNPNTGGFQQVQVPAREFDPGVVTIDGRSFIQGPGGNLTPLGREEVPNLDELINERILSGDAPGALALADFRDRPTSLEAFTAAMQFAQSPGDVAAISAIARGQFLVAPPPSGTVQRIAEQPEFLQDAFQRLINQFRGGSGSPEEFIDVLTRINKERDERGKERDAKDKELTTEKERVRQLELKAAGATKIVTAGASIAFWTGLTADERNQFMISKGIDPASVEVRVENGAVTISGSASVAEPPASTPPQPTSSTTTAAGRGTESIASQTIGGTFDPELNAFFGPRTPDTLQPVSNADTAASAAARLGFSADVDLTSISAIEAALAAPQTNQLSSIARAGPGSGFDFDVGDVEEFALGGTTHHPEHLEIVGEDGPELIQLPPGTNVIPNKDITPAQLKALKKMGVRGMQEGGIVDPLLPFGVRRALAGVIIEPTRRRLSRAAGFPILSAQARQNLLPEELAVFNRLSREAGIPEGAFRQEQESAFPGANLARGRARFAPRVLR